MERGSKFLSFACPVLDEASATEFLNHIRKEHPKARHHCYAYRLLPDGSVFRFDDDNEPHGSAGKPILGQITKYHLTYTIIVTVRYFGGTKLGLAGLTNAYKMSASDALDKGKIIRRNFRKIYRIELPYEKLPLLINFLMQADVPVFNQEYHSDTSFIEIGLPASSHQHKLRELWKEFSKMDFSTLNEYEQYLNFKVEALPGEKIV